MAGLKELRTRLNAVKSTKKITTAMKLVAASKFKKATSALEKNKHYALLVENAAARVLLEYQKEEQTKKITHILPPLLSNFQNARNYLLIVFSSERGLCGSYNQNVAKAVIKRINSLRKEKKSFKIACYGKKAYEILKKNHEKDIIFVEPSFATGGGIFYNEALMLTDKIKNFVAGGSFDACEVIFSRFHSALNREMSVLKAYPLDINDIDIKADADHVGSAYFDYKGSKEEVLDKALQKLLVNRIFGAMLSAEASEQGARMSAMDNATENAKDMIATLNLKYNTLRQSAITTELNEIISGAEAI